ncbi:unnamed protein product, partial [Rotaria magnacalcarata]
MDRNRSIYADISGWPGNSSAQLFVPYHRIQMFCPNSIFGITVADTDQSGNNSNALRSPQHVAFGVQMTLYVSD